MTIHQEILKFLTLFSLLLLGACQIQPTSISCQDLDWYELGRRDGSVGERIEHLEIRAASCKNKLNTSQKEQYKNGRMAGLIEYCSPKNAFELGKSGQNYQSVCAREQEYDFVTHFYRGQRMYELEKENTTLNQKIESLLNSLNKTDLTRLQKNSVQKQIQEIKKRQAQNNQSLKSIQTRVQYIQ